MRSLLRKVTTCSWPFPTAASYVTQARPVCLTFYRSKLALVLRNHPNPPPPRLPSLFPQKIKSNDYCIHEASHVPLFSPRLAFYFIFFFIWLMFFSYILFGLMFCNIFFLFFPFPTPPLNYVRSRIRRQPTGFVHEGAMRCICTPHACE